MNKIFSQIDLYMHETLERKLPDVSTADLENDGAIFYMNGKNGTAFDWYVNNHFPNFYIFYNDKENLGAVKAVLYTDGGLSIYVYGGKGHAKPEQYEVKIDADEQELLNLAVMLTMNADGNKVWDKNIHELDADGKPDKESVELFVSLKGDHEPMIKRKELLGKSVIVSKRVREEGWKIGYGRRDEPTRGGDSGWLFSVGDESYEYINDPKNLEPWLVHSVLLYDAALNEFIAAPYGTAIVRVASDKFELDKPGKAIHIEKASQPFGDFFK